MSTGLDLPPDNVKAYVKRGHQVLVEKEAGEFSAFSDLEYSHAGAKNVEDKKELFDRADMIVKVKGPQSSEYDLFHEGQIL
jgi:alanine dehydrogenase